MAEYTLYGFAQSGNAYKPALALELAGADWAPRFVDYFGGETRTAGYRIINVMGEVPVLAHRGRHFSQSGVILDYLAQTLGQFGPRDDDERREILRWLLFDKLATSTATYRFMRALTKDPNPDVMKKSVRSETAGAVNAHLAGRSFVVGDRLIIADTSMCGYLFFDDEIGVTHRDIRISKGGWRVLQSPALSIRMGLPGHPRR